MGTVSGKGTTSEEETTFPEVSADGSRAAPTLGQSLNVQRLR